MHRKKVKFSIDGDQDDEDASKSSGSPKHGGKAPLAQESGGGSSSSAAGKSNPLARLTLKNVVQKKILSVVALSEKNKARTEKRRGGFIDSGLRSIDFKNLGNLLRKDDDGSLLNEVWAEVKRRTLLRYQTIEKAFRSVDTSGDGAIQFLEFQSLIRNIGMQVDNRAAQFIFVKAAGGDREVTLEEFKNILMAPTLEMLKGMLLAFEKQRKSIRVHVDVFLRRIAMASERNRRTMLYRFQRKISTPFCAGLWKDMKKHLLKTSTSEIDWDIFAKLIKGVPSIRFQAYEMELFQSLFASVDRRRRGKADVLDLCTCLSLLGAEMHQVEKFSFLFKVFDTDDDGCLTHEQILKMYCCAVIHSAIARDDRVTFEADVAFGDELSLQEARRLFEMTLRLLAARGKLDSDAHLQSFDELWTVLRQFSAVLLDRLVPGTHKAAWLLKPGGIPRITLSRWDSHRGALSYDAEKAAEVHQGLSQPAAIQKDEDVKETTLDGFRRHLTRSFRHAMRGEWEAVSLLRTDPLQNSDVLQTSDLFDEDDGGFGDLPAWEPPAPGDPGWSEKHNRTLTEWVRGATVSTNEQMGKRMRSSLSEPTLPTLENKQPRDLASQSLRSSRTMSAKARGSSVASLPSLLPPKERRNDIDRCWQCGEISVEFFGTQAIKTHKHFAREKAVQRRKVREIKPLCYSCGLCADQHELRLPSDPFS